MLRILRFNEVRSVNGGVVAAAIIGIGALAVSAVGAAWGAKTVKDAYDCGRNNTDDSDSCRRTKKVEQDAAEILNKTLNKTFNGSLCKT